jgi:hypothetical protein
MSASYYRSQVKQLESKLKTLRPKHATARKKVADLQKATTDLNKRARSTNSESLRRNYASQAERKEGDLERARDAEVKLDGDISTAETKLSEANAKLAKAEADEQRQSDRKAGNQRKQEERKQRLADQAREREERRREEALAAREAEQDLQIDTLHRRASDLEEQLLAAELRAAPPEITVLFLASSPEDQTQLRLDRETREIQRRIRSSEYRDSIWFEWRLARQLVDLIHDLNEVAPHIVHFSGHGDEDALVFEDEAGNTTELTNEQLGRLLGVGGDRIRLAFFNSCHSEAQARMACDYVDVAIGMNAAIHDEVAKTFAGQFYNSLGFGKSVGESFRQAVLQVELKHGTGQEIPQLFVGDGVDAETVVLVNPDASG